LVHKLSYCLWSCLKSKQCEKTNSFWKLMQNEVKYQSCVRTHTRSRCSYTKFMLHAIQSFWPIKNVKINQWSKSNNISYVKDYENCNRKLIWSEKWTKHWNFTIFNQFYQIIPYPVTLLTAMPAHQIFYPNFSCKKKIVSRAFWITHAKTSSGRITNRIISECDNMFSNKLLTTEL